MAIVVVTGKPGSGKSTLLSVYARRSMRKGIRTLTEFPLCDWIYHSFIYLILAKIPLIRWFLYWIVRTNMHWPQYVKSIDGKISRLFNKRIFAVITGKIPGKTLFKIPSISSRYWLPPLLYGVAIGLFKYIDYFYISDLVIGFFAGFLLKAGWPLYFELPRRKFSKVSALRPLSDRMHRFWTWFNAVDLHFSFKFNPKKDNLAVVYESDVYIDEAQRYYPSIKFKDFTDEERDFFMLHRHNGNMVYLGTGHISRLNINIRQYANEIWDLRSFKIPFTTRPFLILVSKYGSEQEMERGQKYRTSFVFPRQADFDAFSTTQYRTADRSREMKYKQWSFEDVIR